MVASATVEPGSAGVPATEVDHPLVNEEEVRARTATSYEVPFVSPLIAAIRFLPSQASARTVQAEVSFLDVEVESI